MTPLRAGFGLAILLAAFSLACSGGEGDDPPTAEEAAAIVADGLLTVEDLPESNWTAEDNDPAAPEEEGAEDLFASEACADVNEQVEALSSEETEPLAEAEREFTAGDEAALQQQLISSNIIVPDPEVDTDERFEAMREVFAIDTIQPCFEQAFNDLLGGAEGVTVNEITVTEPEDGPTDGISVALDVDAGVMGFPLNLHLEMHFWQSGPAVGQLMMMELNSTVISENAAAIIEAAEGNLTAAVEAD